MLPLGATRSAGRVDHGVRRQRTAPWLAGLLEAGRRAARPARAESGLCPRVAETSDGGSDRVRTKPHRSHGERSRRQRRLGAHGCSTPQATTATSAPARQAAQWSRWRGALRRTVSERLPDAVSVATSRTLLASRIAHASSPTASAPHHAASGSWRYSHVGAADRRDEPEEHEHHHLAEPDVAVRLGSARVGDGRDQRSVTRMSNSHGLTTSESTPPAIAATPNEIIDALRTTAGDARPLATSRIGPLILVGAAHTVGVVVREVDTDLQRQRLIHQRRDRTLPPDRPVDRRRRGPDDHRRNRRPQGFRSRLPPKAEPA